MFRLGGLPPLTWHGNLLTLWTQYKDSEDDGISRTWKSEQSITISSLLVQSLDKNGHASEFCWGTPNQYVALNNKNYLEVFFNGEMVGEKEMVFSSNRNYNTNVSGCILNAHSR